MQEKRSIPRWPLDWEAKIKLKNKKGAFSACIVHDITLKGLKVSTKEKFPKEKFINLMINIPNSLMLDNKFEIRWQKRDGEGLNMYGLKFADLSDSEKEKIYKFIYGSLSKEVSKKWWEGTK
jgi:c-di-GMP-binding flagellar brake protein YcgR